MQDIELLRCNGSVAWQMSLVRAIQRASPLPAPGVHLEGFESGAQLRARQQQSAAR